MSRSIVHADTVGPCRLRLAHALALALCTGAAHATTYSAGTEAELIQAINDANANAGANTINVTVDITLTAALPVITGALTIQGSGGHHAIRRDDTGTNACSPTATNAFRLIDAGADLTLNDLTLSGGCNLVDQGGAVRVQNATLTVARSTISGNQTFFPDPAAYCYGQCIGGGIAVLQGSASVTDSLIADNTANGYLGSGGGIAVYQGELTLAHSTVSGNHAEGGAGSSGGGIYVAGAYPNGPAGSLTITGSVISGNVSHSDGAFGGGAEAYIADVTLSDSVISGNRANGGSNARGGGVVVQNFQFATSALIQRTFISSNAITGSQGFGAGIDAAGVALNLLDSTVANNTVTGDAKARAGALMIENTVVTVSNSTLSGNSVNGPVSGGGAIMVDSDDDSLPAALDLRNSTVTGNSSNNTGGGIYLKRDVPTATTPSATIESSIVAGNQGANGLDAIGAEPATPAAVTTDHSLIQGNADVGTGTLALDATTLSLWNADPQLLPLAYNGGRTPTHALAATSPAIDRGTNSQNLANDQRGGGYARAVGAAPDVGAYEFDPDRIYSDGFE